MNARPKSKLKPRQSKWNALAPSRSLSLSLSHSVSLSLSHSQTSTANGNWVAPTALPKNVVWLSADCAATSTLRESNKNWTKRNWNWNQSCLECCGISWNTRAAVCAFQSSWQRDRRQREREWARMLLSCFVFIRFVSIGKPFVRLPIMEVHVLSRSRTRLDSKPNGACSHQHNCAVHSNDVLLSLSAAWLRYVGSISESLYVCVCVCESACVCVWAY